MFLVSHQMQLRRPITPMTPVFWILRVQSIATATLILHSLLVLVPGPRRQCIILTRARDSSRHRQFWKLDTRHSPAPRYIFCGKSHSGTLCRRGHTHSCRSAYSVRPQYRRTCQTMILASNSSSHCGRPSASTMGLDLETTVAVLLTAMKMGTHLAIGRFTGSS